jgi:D-alanyl-D-alanine carboxypeptidase
VLTIPAEAIDACLTSAMLKQRIPGVALAVGRGGELLYSCGYGYRSIPYRAAPDASTIFSIASISKQFAAATIMRFVERGRLSLDEPMGRYFPVFAYGGNVLIRHLLQHVSGIPGYTEVPNFDRICKTKATPDEIIAMVAERPPAFRPGEEWQYSNTNYVVLGRLLELIDGAPYADVLQREIFEPLGLANTGVDDVKRVRENAADPYTSYALGEFEHAVELDPSWEYSTGGLYSNCTDLVRWNHALRGGAVVTPESFTLMSTSGVLNDGTSTGYGFGLGVNEVGGLREVRHSGGLPGFSLENVTYPDLDLDLVVLTNHDGITTNYSIIHPVLALVLDRPELATVKPPTDRPVVPKAAPPQPAHWVAATREGRIDDLGLTEEFQRFLTRARRADLQRLTSLGSLHDARLLDTYRRDPNTSFYFRLAFERRTLIGSISVSDDGLVSHVSFSAWDERPLD